MTQKAFDAGYWYATEIKAFARSIGIANHARLRKDELEKSIRHFLKTGKVAPSPRTIGPRAQVKDVEKGLSLSLPIVRYTSNKETKAFILNEALKIDPKLKKKSGARYRLNRWREEQMQLGRKITYGNLVRRYVLLNQSEEKFARIPSGRYINFLSDFLSREKGSTRTQAVAAWHKLKNLPIEKNYPAWRRYQNGISPRKKGR